MDFDKANRTLKALKATGKMQTVSLGNSSICRVGVRGGLRAAFIEAADDYVETCRKLGKAVPQAG